MDAVSLAQNKFGEKKRYLKEYQDGFKEIDKLLLQMKDPAKDISKPGAPGYQVCKADREENPTFEKENEERGGGAVGRPGKRNFFLKNYKNDVWLHPVAAFEEKLYLYKFVTSTIICKVGESLLQLFDRLPKVKGLIPII
eukprot:bmy_12417T0